MAFDFGSKVGATPPRKKSSFMSPAASVDDPLAGGDYVGDGEADSVTEFQQLHKGYRERKKAEDDRFRAATDSEFWVALCFKSRAEKESFLSKANLTRLGDKYIDGRQAAKMLKLPPL